MTQLRMRSKASNDLPLAEVSTTLPATAEHLGSVYAALAEFWTKLERCHPSPPDSGWRAYFETAVGEIVANIIQYAYASPSTGGEMSIDVHGFRDRVEATFRDRGAPYSGSLIPDVHLAAVDDLSYTREADINYWRFMKKL
jgi:anti-sigma regulatory factor (Ser/Thr protein kinase)